MPPVERATADLERAALRQGRQLALAAVFEAEFGQRTAMAVLERRLIDEPATLPTADHARRLVTIAVEQRASLDAQISDYAPQFPVGQLARIDRALLRLGLGELLHCPTTPARLAIAEWVELARTYSGEPARRLINGVLGRVAREATGRGREMPASGNSSEGGGDRHRREQP